MSRFIKYFLFISKFFINAFLIVLLLVVYLLTTKSGLYATIKLAGLLIPSSITITNATGSLLKGFKFSTFQYVANNMEMRISKGELDWDLTQLFNQQLVIKHVSGDKVFFQYFPIKSSTSQLAHINLPLNISIKRLSLNETKVKMFGKDILFKNVQFASEFNNINWKIKALRFNIADLDYSLNGDGQSQTPYRLSVNLKIQSLNSAFPLWGHFNLEGNKTNYQLNGFIDGLGKAVIKGELNNSTFVNANATWKNLHWPLKHTINSVEIAEGGLQLEGRVSDLHIKANTKLNNPFTGELTITSNIKNNQMELDAFFNSLSEKFKTTISTNVSYTSVQQALIKIQIQPGTSTLIEKVSSKLPFAGGELNVDISPQALQATGHFEVDKNKQMQATFKIPKFRLDDPNNKNYTTKGKLDVHINSLNFIPNSNDFIRDAQGQLLINLSISGKLKNPQLQGKLSLTNGSVFIPIAGLRYGPIHTTLYTVGKQWRVSGSILSGSNAIFLTGQGDFSPLVKGKIDLVGNHFQLMKTEEFDITVTPKLSLNLNSHDLNITGNVDIPMANIKPTTFDNIVELPDDVIFIEENESKNTHNSPLSIAANVELTLGKNVAIDIKKIKGMLEGAIRIKKNPGGPFTAFGSFAARDAKYSAYGQNLSIEKAQLLFTGGPIDNPGINARAVRKFNNTAKFSESNQLFNFSSENIEPIDLDKKFTVGIQVSGRLKSTDVTLFSIPANLSQADIISLLILGKPINKANKAGYQVLVSALSSLGLGSTSKGGALLEQIKEKTGIDVSLESHTSYNHQTNQSSDKTSLVIKKPLSKRLVLSYNISLLGSDNNVLVLKYLLNKFFSIQINSTDAGNSIDFVYSNS